MEESDFILDKTPDNIKKRIKMTYISYLIITNPLSILEKWVELGEKRVVVVDYTTTEVKDKTQVCCALEIGDNTESKTYFGLSEFSTETIESAQILSLGDSTVKFIYDKITSTDLDAMCNHIFENNKKRRRELVVTTKNSCKKKKLSESISEETMIEG